MANSPLTHVVILDHDETVYIETNSGEFMHLLSTFNLKPDKEADYGELGMFQYFSCSKSLLGEIFYESTIESSGPNSTPEQGNSEPTGGHVTTGQEGESF